MNWATAYAETIDDLIFKINANILNPIIELGFAVALVIFLYGLIQFLAGSKTPDKKVQGKKHMLWGLIGLLIMFSVFGIINLLISTMGITGATINNKEQTFVPPTIQDIRLPEIKSQN